MTPQPEQADPPASNVIPFVFEEQLVRVFTIDGDPWFVLADLCNVLGLTNPSKVAADLDPDEVTTLTISEGHGGPARNIVSESGFYALVFKSRKPEAKRFRKWVTAEVLPAIRRTGRYDLREEPGQAPMSGDGDLPLQELSLKIALVREARYTFGVRQARSAWRALNLPFVDEVGDDRIGAMGCDVLDTILQAATPLTGRTVLERVRQALDGDGAARAELAPIGIKVDDRLGALLIANNTRFITRMFRDRGAPHFLALRQITGATVPDSPRMFGKKWSRCTALPLAEIENVIFGDRDIFEEYEPEEAAA